jgi:hypothetical protein
LGPTPAVVPVRFPVRLCGIGDRRPGPEAGRRLAWAGSVHDPDRPGFGILVAGVAGSLRTT